jgi:hypothetical protein
MVATSQAEDRGLVQDDRRAQEVFRLGTRPGVMATARLKTLAGQPRATVMTRARTSQAPLETPAGPRACLQVTVEREGGRQPRVARFGGSPLRRQRTAVLTDLAPILARTRRHALSRRRLTERGEGWDAEVPREGPHGRQRADLTPPGRRERPAWLPRRAMRRRQTRVVCRRGPEDMHAGRSRRPART